MFTRLAVLGAVAWPAGLVLLGSHGLFAGFAFQLVAPAIAGFVRGRHPWLWGAAPLTSLALVGVGLGAVSEPRVLPGLLLVLGGLAALGAALAAFGAWLARRGPHALIPPWF